MCPFQSSSVVSGLSAVSDSIPVGATKKLENMVLFDGLRGFFALLYLRSIRANQHASVIHAIRANRNRLRSSALSVTVTVETLISSADHSGARSTLKAGYKTPAAIGIATTL